MSSVKEKIIIIMIIVSNGRVSEEEHYISGSQSRCFVSIFIESNNELKPNLKKKKTHFKIHQCDKNNIKVLFVKMYFTCTLI